MTETTKTLAAAAFKKNRSTSLSPNSVDRFSPEESVDFSVRLREAIGEEKQNSFARRCNLSNGLLSAYARGEKMPGIKRLVTLADAAGVTVDWLATGRLPKTRAELKALQDTVFTAPTGFDMARLQTAIEAAEEGLAQAGRVMSADKKAELVLAVYDLLAEPAITKERVLKLVKLAA